MCWKQLEKGQEGFTSQPIAKVGKYLGDSQRSSGMLIQHKSDEEQSVPISWRFILLYKQN